MKDKKDRSLQERVEQLEMSLEKLQRVLKRLVISLEQKGLVVLVDTKENSSLPKAAAVDTSGGSSGSAQKATTKVEQTASTGKAPYPTDVIWKSEYWLNKIGIGLFLFGVAFMFKYSIDQGWITPPVRVGFGLFLGIVLLITGFYTYASRRHFSLVLLGGSIATFYITGFATFQLYALVSYQIAFAFMVSVTFLAFFISLRQDEAILSLIGVLGGLGTPFLLYTGSGSLPALISYTCLILGLTSAIYIYRGWLSILWVSVIGGWMVFLFCYIKGIPENPQMAIKDCWALQLGIIYGWFVFWILPLIREILCEKNPVRWPKPSINLSSEYLSKDFSDFLKSHMHLLTVSTPLIVLALTGNIWSLSSSTLGWLSMGGSFFYVFVALILKRWNVIKALAYTHVLVALLLLTVAVCLLLEGDVLFFALTAEATALHFISYRLSDRGTMIYAHLLFIVLAMLLANRLINMETEGTAILNTQALTEVVVILAGFIASLLVKSSDEKQIYRFCVHAAILGWFYRELFTLPNGQGYVTIAWGIYAVIILLCGLRLNYKLLVTVAMGTLLMVVGKLFLVDIASLKAIWRILLFLCFGGMFLLLSYYFNTLWRSKSRT